MAKATAHAPPILVPDVGETGAATEEKSLHEKDADSESQEAPAPVTPEVTDAVEPVNFPVVERKRKSKWARLTIISEVEDPYAYSNRVKWTITFIVAIAAMAAPVGVGVIFPVLSELSEYFHTSSSVINLSAALYMLSTGIFPLWWSAFSELSGRRPVYLVSFALFILFAVVATVSRSAAVFIAMRMLSGGAAASVQSVGAGTIADIWEVRERGRAFGIFYLGPLLGPLSSPIVGGLVGQRWGWRATQVVLVIFGAVVFLMLLFCLPETHRPKKTASEEIEVEATPGGTETANKPAARRRKINRALRMFFVQPFVMIGYLRYPAIAFTCYIASVAMGCLYILNIGVQYSFSRPPYNFSTLIVGLLYIPNSLGYMLGSVVGGRWMDYIMRREATKAGRRNPEGGLIFRPEDRMRENAWLAAVLYPCALIWYGWTVDKGIIWIVPMLANFFFGFGSILVFTLVTTTLTEFMPHNTSAGVALNNLVRNFFSCAGIVAAQAWFEAIGTGWVFTILGGWALLNGVVIWWMRRQSETWRMKMDRALANKDTGIRR